MTLFWILDFGFSIGRSKRGNVICLALGALLFALCSSVAAQQQAKVAKIGWLGARPISDPGGGYEILRQELRALGYVEGKNIVFEYRSAIISPNASPLWPMSWCVSKLTCLSRLRAMKP